MEYWEKNIGINIRINKKHKNNTEQIIRKLNKG